MSVLYLDKDGVLVNFIKGFYQLHGITECLYRKESNKGNWDIIGLMESQIGIKTKWNELGYQFWSNLEWMPDGKQILKIIEDRFDNIYLLSSPNCNNDECEMGKIAWVRKHLPKYENKLIIEHEKEKYANKRSLLIDDSDKNVSKFIMAGGSAITVPRLWNSNYRHANYVLSYLIKSLDNGARDVLFDSSFIRQ